MLVDASVGLKWFLQETDADLAEQLSLEHDLVAPTLFAIEMANGLWKAARAGAMTTAAAAAAIETIDARIDRFLPDYAVAQRALEIACLLGHAVYDCVYLAHCERDRQRLVTADQRLLDRVANTDFAPYCVLLSEAF
jgi:predicted nucleic acid-binding protein